MAKRRKMDKTMRLGACVLIFVLGVLFASYLISNMLTLLNAPSDMSVGAGVLLLGGVAYIILWGVTKMIKTIARLGVVLLLLFGTLSCTRVGAGHVGIVINMSGSQRGVSEMPVTTGWVFYNPFTETVFEYPIFVQTAVWTKSLNEGRSVNEEISFNSKEGLMITGDISLSYQLAPDRVPYFYVKFRSDDLERFTHGYLRNVARDQFNEVAGKYMVEELYGPKKEEFTGAVKNRINEAVKDVGVHIEQFGFIGAPRPPQNVIDALNAKVAATQLAMQAENELRRAEAEAKKRVASARGEADANQILATSVTDRLLEIRRLQILESAVSKWDGKRPMVEGSGSGLLLQIPMGAVGAK